MRARFGGQRVWSFRENSEFSRKLVKTRSFQENSEFSRKLGVFGKTRSFCENSEFLRKLGVFPKTRSFQLGVDSEL